MFNHTTEEDELGPTYNLRGLADRDFYVVNDDGSYVDDSGTGNIIDPSSPPAQELVMEALDRFADLGVDGFRFDLASVLARDPAFVVSIGDWAAQRGVRLVAEPWDIARYLLGRGFPDDRWMQWNDRFRDDMRGFLRAEPGLVPAVMQRLQGSPDIFDHPMRSVNFLTAHDGFTMYDLVAYDHKHNDANGWNGTDGPDENRSWNCGWEGDDGVPDEVDGAPSPPAAQRDVPADARATACRCSWPVTSSPARSTATTTRTTRTTRRRGSTGSGRRSSPTTSGSSSGSSRSGAAHAVLSDGRLVGRSRRVVRRRRCGRHVVRIAIDRVPSRCSDDG